MDVESLTPQQLMVLKNQLEQELEKFSASFQQLRHASTKYRAGHSAIEQLEERDILVPLTGSLYIPGRLVNPQKIVVDIGTGYYVQKNKQDARSFCERKIALLKENMEKVSTFINQRRRTLEVVVQTLQKKSAQQTQIQR